MKVKIYPTASQKKVLDQFIDTSRYVYNRTLEQIKKGHKVNFQTLRDMLVTNQTKKGLDEYKEFQYRIKTLQDAKKHTDDKDEKENYDLIIKETYAELRNVMKRFPATKNPLIKDFEVFTHKDIRANAVKQCCDAFKSGFSNLKNGNIKFFNPGYKKKSERRQTIEFSSKCISITNGKIKILPSTLNKDCYFKVSRNNKKKLKNIKISYNVDLVKHKTDYYLHICVDTCNTKKENMEIIAGVDMGIRTFATVYSNNFNSGEVVISEYKHRADLLKKLNNKIDSMKKHKERIRWKQFHKIEKKKSNVVDRLHWDFINHLLLKNDIIYFGDIKSHDIVKKGKIKTINRNFNDLKFYTLKQRLLYKASLLSKIVIVVPEHYTTKTCSSCGMIDNNVGSKEAYSCINCNLCTGRDINAAKNIKMKGFFL